MVLLGSLGSFGRGWSWCFGRGFGASAGCGLEDITANEVFLDRQSVKVEAISALRYRSTDLQVLAVVLVVVAADLHAGAGLYR